MMIAMSVGEVADLVGGTLEGVPNPRGAVSGEIVIDSRDARAGDLFVAVPGERVDGHDFCSAAVGNGAVAALAQRPVDAPAILVDDTVKAMGILARKVLARL